MIGDSKTNGLGGAGVGVCARLPVYVLTGGASSRFGADKANHPIDGEPWAVHVGRRLAPDGSFTLVGDVAVDASGVRRIVEGCPGFGPLGGVTAACRDRFEASGDGWLVVASCDLVRPTRDWLTPLRDATTATALAVAYRDRERWQPMPLIAHTRWADCLEATLESGDRSLQTALTASAAVPVVWPGPGVTPPQANTRRELEGLLASME